MANILTLFPVPINDNPSKEVRRGLLRMTRDEVEAVFEPVVSVSTVPNSFRAK